MLALRVVTALVLAPLFIAGIFGLPPAGFALFIGVFLLLSGWEWAGLCEFGVRGRVIWSIGLAACAAGLWFADLRLLVALLGSAFWLFATIGVFLFPRGRALWARVPVRAFAGVAMMIPAWAGLTLLQARSGGPWLVLWTMVLVWAADIGGYFAGRAFGRHKLMPEVSPGKTIEGMAGGAILALVLSGALAALAAVDAGHWIGVVAVSLLVILASVIGDLMESLVKRVAGVKDSGTLLPGHGGVLDRVDGVLAAAPVAAALLTALDVVPGGWMERILS